MKKGARTALILVAALAALLAAAAGGAFLYGRLGGEGSGAQGFFSFRPAGRRPGEADRGGQPEKFSVPVAVTAARREEVREILTLYGSVFADSEVDILTTVSGKISRINVAQGDVVREDEVLAVIDRDQAGLKFAPVEVESTISGVVKSVLTQEGATANPGVPLFEIVDMDEVEVVVDVPEKRIDRVRVGQPAEISVVSYPDRVFRGTIDALSPVVDPVSRTLETRIRVDNRGYRLKPGMFAEARVILRRRERAVTVPLSALVEREGAQTVFVVEGETAREVEPRIAFVQSERVVIESGIDEGDLVVVVGQQSLSGGDAVTVAEVKE
jgi:multidrug efflux pump subunit AcrA (membrane-fusion protein)